MITEPKKPVESRNNAPATPPVAAQQNNNIDTQVATQPELARKPTPFEGAEVIHEQQAQEELEMTQAPTNLQENIDIEQGEDV